MFMLEGTETVTVEVSEAPANTTMLAGCVLLFEH
jgi:hypothetical protein